MNRSQSMGVVRIVTGLLILLILLTGCNTVLIVTPSTASPSPSKTITLPVFPATYTPQATPLPEIKYELSKIRSQTITLWHPWTGARGTAMAQLVQDFNRENTYDIKLELSAWGSTGDLYTGLLSTQEKPPDIVVLPPELIRSGMESSTFTDLGVFIKNDNSNIRSDYLEDTPVNLIQPVREGDHIYGLPSTVDTSVFIYDKTWANNLGFSSIPSTWEEFKNQLCAAAIANNHSRDLRNRGTGGLLEDNSILANLGWIQMQGGDMPFISSQTETLAGPHIESTFQKVNDLSSSGCSWHGRNPTPIDYFIQRKALMIHLQAAKVQAFQIYMDTAGFTDEWQVISYPDGNGENHWVPSVQYYSIIDSVDGSSNLAAWMVLRWLTNPETEKRLSLSDGSLPGRTSSWESVQKAGTMPRQLVEWMAISGEPVVPPYLPGWSYAADILKDGFYQARLATTTKDNVSDVIEMMEDMVVDIQEQLEE